ncbi:hypothetical protein D9M69_581170 [compost metagenome]
MDVGVLDVVAVQAVQHVALKFFAEHRGTQAVKDQEHPHSAGVHDMGLVQGCQLVFGADHDFEGRLHRCVQGESQDMVAVVAVLLGVHSGGGARSSLHNREHGPRNRIAQRRPGADLGAVKRGCEQRRAQAVMTGQRLRSGAQEHSEQCAGIAACLLHRRLACACEYGPDVLLARGPPGLRRKFGVR